jgi:hypothetical protein
MRAEKIVAVDKVANKLRFYDPSLAEMKALDGPEPCVHELALTADRRTAFVPLYGDGIYGNNKRPNNKVLVVDLVRMEIADMIALGEYTAPHGMTATREGKLWVTCDIPNKLVCVDPQARAVEAVYDNPAKGGHLVEKLADDSKLYVSAKEGPLAALDLARRAFVATVPLAAPWRRLAQWFRERRHRADARRPPAGRDRQRSVRPAGDRRARGSRDRTQRSSALRLHQPEAFAAGQAFFLAR